MLGAWLRLGEAVVSAMQRDDQSRGLAVMGGRMIISKDWS